VREREREREREKERKRERESGKNIKTAGERQCAHAGERG